MTQHVLRASGAYFICTCVASADAASANIEQASAVPEPSTSLLIGLAAFIFMLKKRKR